LYYYPPRRATERASSSGRKQQRQDRHERNQHDAVVDSVQFRGRAGPYGQRAHTEQNTSKGEGVSREGSCPGPTHAGEHGNGSGRQSQPAQTLDDRRRDYLGLGQDRES
jgi:hypothetical protein